MSPGRSRHCEPRSRGSQELPPSYLRPGRGHPEEGPVTRAREPAAALHRRHRPARRRRGGRRLDGRATRPGSTSTACPRCSTAPTSSWSACSAAGAPGRTGSTRSSRPGMPAVVLGGEAAPDAELMALSTVPAGVVDRGAAPTSREGGPENLRELAGFLSRHAAADRRRFEPPRALPAYGVHGDVRRGRPADGRGRLLPGARALRQHRLRRHAVPPRSRRGRATPLPVYCGSLRGLDPTSPRTPGCSSCCGSATPWSPPCSPPAASVAADASAGGDDDAWDAGALADARRPGDPGPRPDLDARAVAGQSTPRCQPDGRGDAGRDPGVRRAADHGPVLLQGVRRRRRARVRRRPGAGRPARRDRGRARPAAARAERATSGSRSCCRRTRPSTRGSATRSAWTPRPRRSSCSVAASTPGTTSATSI